MNRKYLVALALLFWSAAPLSGQTIKEGIEAWQRGNYAAAVGIWTPLAEQGDADAQFNLGQAYRLGRGVQTNIATAKGWFEKAANQGHIDAQTTLGLLLFENSDQAEGLKWLKKAAEQGDPRSQLVYGTALVNGDSVTQDPALGYAYISRAAAQGLAPAKATLEQLDHIVPASDRKRGLGLARQLAKRGTKGVKSSTRPLEVASAKPGRKPAAKSVAGKAEAAQARPNSSPAPVETAAAEPGAAKPRSPSVRGASTETSNTGIEMASATPTSKREKPARASAAGSQATAKSIAPPRPVKGSGGSWRVQLGAFAQKGNAEGLYQKLSGKAALSGLSPYYVPVGSITRLQVGPFDSKASAQAACRAIGIACFPVAAQ